MKKKRTDNTVSPVQMAEETLPPVPAHPTLSENPDTTQDSLPLRKTWWKLWK
jgi:hypothetical protein